MDEQVKQLIDMVAQMMKTVSETPELTQSMARAYRNMFDALKKENFTDEQAMAIICNQGLGIQKSS